MPRRPPTPGRMYRRAELRAYAESTAIAATISSAPLELPTDAPSFSTPEIVSAIGCIDPVVHTIAPLTESAPYTPRRPSARRPAVVLATIAVSIIGVTWLAWPTLSTTGGEPTPEAAPVAVIEPIPPPPRSVVQSPPLPSAPASPRELPTRTRALDAVLRITSDPTGARVTVNGVGWGSTPLAIRNLPPGSKTIRVTKDGYVTDERIVSLSGVSPSSVQLRLRRIPDRPPASTTRAQQR